MIKKQLVFVVAIFVTVVIISGCSKKPMTVETLTDKDNTTSSDEKNIEKIPDLKVSDIKEWVTFKNEKLNFSFDFPASWEYSIKDLNSKWKRITFKSDTREKEMIIDIPVPAVGLETWETTEAKSYLTNDPNTDILVKHMKSRNEDDKMNTIFLFWQTGVKGDALKEGFKTFDENSGMLALGKYHSQNDLFYKSIIEKVAESFQFTLK